MFCCVGLILLFSIFLSMTATTRPTAASECDLTVHNFACHHYYQQLQEALIKDKNELFWLQKAFFPEQLQPPETIKIILRITIGHIANQSCARNDQLPAYYYDGAGWRGEWELILSSSVLLAFVSEEVLFTFDNTITWALHAMSTGLGAALYEGGSVGMHVHSLPCMPSMDIVTETLILLGSRLKAFARHQDIPSSWDEVDKLEVSRVNTITNSGSGVLVYENTDLGNTLLVVAFALLNILAAFSLCKLTMELYPKLWEDWIAKDNQNTYSLYWATTCIFLGLNIMTAGVLVIAHIYRKPDLQHCYSKGDDETCGSVFVVWVSAIRSVLSTIIAATFLAIAFRASSQCTDPEEDKKSRIPLVVTWFFCWLPMIICKLLCKVSKVKTCRMSRWCNSRQNVRPTIVYALALASNLMFLQQMVGALIPSFILLLLYPEHVISGLIFIAAAIFCIVIFVAHIIHTDRYHKKGASRRIFSIPLQGLFVLLLVVLIGAILAFYVLLLSHGIRTRGIYGFLLSLLPPAILAAIGGLVKHYLFGSQPKATGTESV